MGLNNVPLVSDTSEFIKLLYSSKLSAYCPNCRESFTLADSLLFDGTKKFPDKAEQVRKELLSQIDERVADLVERQKKAKTQSEKAAISVGIGKIVEKILPTHKNFAFQAADCRFLGEPIDMIVFDSISENSVKHITFLDVKTGDARLNTHQKLVRDAINEGNVQWRMV